MAGGATVATVSSLSNPYLELTAQFDDGRLRILLSSGQVVVFHRLAIMSKDGDWSTRTCCGKWLPSGNCCTKSTPASTHSKQRSTASAAR